MVGKPAPGSSPGYGAVVLDDLNFSDVANLSEFDASRTLSFYPPDGEFVLLNYRIAGEYPCPFKIRPGEPRERRRAHLQRGAGHACAVGGSPPLPPPLPARSRNALAIN